MIQVIDRSNAHRHKGVLRSYGALRHEVFIRRLGWRIPCGEDGVEQDQFDGPDAVYLTVSNRSDEVVGGVRLLNMAGRSLLREVFPHLVDGAIPASPTVLELTRFAVDHRRDRLSGCGDVSAELLWGLQEYGLWSGITQFVSVSSLGLEPLLRRAGYRFRRMGTPALSGGAMVTALKHEVSLDICHMTSRRLKPGDSGVGQIIE